MIQPISPLLLFAILVLISCSTTSSKKYIKSCESSQWYQHQYEIRSLHKYQIHGTFAYFSDKHKICANFFWQQINQSHYRILITSLLLGGTELEINIWPDLVRFFNNKEQYYTHSEAEIIFGKFIGVLIPFNILQQWILGLPGDNVIDYKLNNQHRLSEIYYKQNGKVLKVIYKDYNSETQPTLPKSIELTEGNRRIKLRIYNWIIR